MYLEQIEQLVVLQKVDDEIIILESELENLPKELAELEAKSDEQAQRLAQVDEKVEILKTQRKRLEGEIEDNAAMIKKSKNKLMMAGNTREYHAMMREMDNLEKVNRTREEERVALAEELERQDGLRGEFAGEAAELDAKLEEYNANIKKRTATAKKRLATLAKKRETACAVVPAPVLGRYEFIRARITNPVIVPVVDGVCSGCNIRIPPQIFIDLQKGEQIISCPNCQRLTYWCEHFQDQEAAPASEAEARERAAEAEAIKVAEEAEEAAEARETGENE